MRPAIVALIAIALVSPSAAALAADASRDAGSAPVQTVSPLAERIALPRRQPKKMARRQAKRKIAKSTPVSKRPEIARPAPTIESPQPARQASQAGAPPACSSNHKLENDRRCLRLAQPGPAPTSMPSQKPSIASFVPEAPFATPSRSWLGAFSKCIVTQIVEIAEVLFVDRADWRMAMADEIQQQLEQARSREQQARLKKQEKPNHHIGQAAPKDAPAAPRPRRAKGAQI